MSARQAVQRIAGNGIYKWIAGFLVSILLTVIGTLAWSDHQKVVELPEKYVCKTDAQVRWDQHMKKESDERAEYLKTFESINAELKKANGRLEQIIGMHSKKDKVGP